jgi:hypothetical protein
MAVDINATATGIEPGTPKQLFQYPIGNGLFDITPDGQHFPFSAVAGAIGQSAGPDDTPLTVVLKWTSALKK